MGDQAPQIVLTDASSSKRVVLDCPQCGDDTSRRVKSSGFGEPHDVCGKCGHEWSREESL